MTADVESYLYGNLLLITDEELDIIVLLCFVSMLMLGLLRSGLLAVTIDPITASVQGIPVQWISRLFALITACVVVSMVKVLGAILVTALLVTPAATAQMVGNSFKSCMIWTQAFAMLSVLGGLYFSAEMDTGAGSMIAVVAASIFIVVVIFQNIVKVAANPTDN